MRSNEEHAKLNNSGCPVCRALDTEVEYGGIEIDTDCAVQEASCMTCGAAWSNEYHVSGFTLDKSPDSPRCCVCGVEITAGVTCESCTPAKIAGQLPTPPAGWGSTATPHVYGDGELTPEDLTGRRDEEAKPNGEPSPREIFITNLLDLGFAWIDGTIRTLHLTRDGLLFTFTGQAPHHLLTVTSADLYDLEDPRGPQAKCCATCAFLDAPNTSEDRSHCDDCTGSGLMFGWSRR